MTAPHERTPQAPPPDADPVVYDADEISLRPYVEALWRYRRVIQASLAGVAVIFVLGTLVAWLLMPTERVASIQFRLLFEGAANNRYPNGAPFSPAEIVGAPVVTQVFTDNDLQRYGKYEDFKEALFVQQSNPELDLLALEYQSRLADTKLGPVDRARIEDEFKKKREALDDPSFSLTLRRSERFSALPKELAQKILTDTLEEFAKQAELRRGALTYQIPLLSSSILSRESLEKDDYLVAADQLRSKAVRVIRSIERMEKLPGALTVRTAKGAVSLSEVRASLEDSIRFDLEPLLGIIRSEGVTRNARLLSLYATNMVFQLKLDKQEAESRANALKTALREYVAQTNGAVVTQDATGGPQGRQGTVESPGLIAQLSDSFLTRLQDMAAVNQKDEMDYRRKLNDQVIEASRTVATYEKELRYYEDLSKSLEGVSSRSAGSPELVALIRTRSERAFSTVEKAINQLSELYKELSRQNLAPESRLFAITGPFVQHTRTSLSLQSVVVLFALVILLTLLVVPAGCLLHNAARSRTR